MNLTKEDCLNELEILCNYADGNPSSSREFVGKMLQEADDTLLELIEEYFKIIKEKERLEKALDKACEELEIYSYKEGIGQVGMCYKEWKEWCLKDE